MARGVKSENEGDGVAAFRGNGFDPAITGKFVERIENLHGDIASAKGAFMAECKVIQTDIKEVYKEAKGAGIPKKSLKAVVAQRQKQRELDEIREDLEGEDQESFDQIVLALGKFADTDLGAAAAAKAA